MKTRIKKDDIAKAKERQVQSKSKSKKNVVVNVNVNNGVEIGRECDGKICAAMCE